MDSEPPPHTDTLTLPSGRVLAWTIYGTPLNETTPSNTSTIFYFHGFPGSRYEAGLLPMTTLETLHARCISIDRPGMGLSTHYPSRRISEWPADVLAVADYLGIQHFHILAFSGGAPYALECARSIPRVHDDESGEEGRLLRVTIVSGTYPVDAGMKEMLAGPDILLLMGAWLPRYVTGGFIDWMVGRKARSTDPKLLEAFFDKDMSQKPEHERKCMEGEHFRRVAIDATRESLRQGAQGPATDLMLLSDVGFKLEDMGDAGDGICMWHGKEDANAPFAMAEKAARVLSRAQFRALDGVGHLSTPLNFADEILRDLVQG